MSTCSARWRPAAGEWRWCCRRRSFRIGAEGEIRRKILEMDAGGGDWAGAEPVLRHRAGRGDPGLPGPQATERAGQVLFVDGSGLYRRGRNQNTLEPEHAAQILALYSDYRDAPGAAHVATLAEIERNDWNLNIPGTWSRSPPARRSPWRPRWRA